MKFFTILVAFAISTVSAFAQTWITNPANGHLYTSWVADGPGWQGAEQRAVSYGGHLVTINDSAENEWVRITFELNGGSDEWCWIGLYELQPWGQSTRSWAWSSGESPTYTNWGSGDPSSSAEHWVAMDGDGWWRDLAGDWQAPIRHIAVAEVVPEPTTMAVFGLGLHAFTKRRRK